jgi:hypothetical protein
MLNKQDASVITRLNKQLAGDATANKTLPWLSLRQENGSTELVATHEKQDGPLPPKGGLLSVTSASNEILATNLKAYDDGGIYVGKGNDHPRSPSAEADLLLKLTRSGNDNNVQGELKALIGQDPSYLDAVGYSLGQAAVGGGNVPELTLKETDGSLGATNVGLYNEDTEHQVWAKPFSAAMTYGFNDPSFFKDLMSGL